MAAQADLEVVGVVIHQVDFLVTRAVDGAQTTCIHAVVAGVIQRRAVFVAVDVHRIEATGVAGVHKRAIHRAVIGGFPIVGREGECVDFVRKHGVAFVVFKHIGPTEPPFVEVAFSHAVRRAQTVEDKWVLGLHVDDAVERAWAEVRGARTRHDLDRLHVEVWRAKEVAKGEVQPGALVVHPIDELQRTHRRRAVEPSGVHDFESERRRGQIDPFQVAKPFVETSGGGLLDRQGVHRFHRQRGLLLFVADALAHHLCSFNEDLVGNQLDVDALVGLGDLHLFEAVANEADVQCHGQRRHVDAEATVEIGHHPLRCAVHHDAGRKHRLAGVPVFDESNDGGLGHHGGGHGPQHKHPYRLSDERRGACSGDQKGINKAHVCRFGSARCAKSVLPSCLCSEGCPRDTRTTCVEISPPGRRCPTIPRGPAPRPRGRLGATFSVSGSRLPR